MHVGRPTSVSIDRAVDRQKAKNSIFRDLKVVFLLLINSPFDLEIMALKYVDKTTDMVGKTSPKNLLKSCLKQPKGAPIYRLIKTSRWGPNQQFRLLSVDRQRSDF